MRYVVLALLMVLGCGNLAKVQAVEVEQRESLRGLPGVIVFIEDISKDAQTDGLPEKAIRTAVELVLRTSGIRVLSQDQFYAMPSAPMLGISISTSKARSSAFYAFAIRMELGQTVSLPYTTKKEVIAATWQAGSFGTLKAGRIREVTSFVEALAKQFANDFLAVNPQ